MFSCCYLIYIMKKVFAILFVVCLHWCVVLRNAQRPPQRDFRQFMLNVEKKKEFPYNPNQGYEPYWADGEWVLSTTTLHPDIPTTKKPTICGDECNYVLQRIKHVCAHFSHYAELNGCLWRIYCTGKPGDDLNPGFKTFDTYCQFLDAQCRDRFDNKGRWVLVYIGKCRLVEDDFKPLWDASTVAERMKSYISTYYETYYSSYPTTRTGVDSAWNIGR